jgi:LEA14-like dessication related protein
MQQKIASVDQEEIEAELSENLDLDKKNKVGISVIGNTASCYLNEVKIVNTEIASCIEKAGKVNALA